MGILRKSGITYALLDSVDGLHVALVVGRIEDLRDEVQDVGLEVLLVDKHDHGNHDLADEDDQQEAGIGHGHAVRLLDGATAAEEGDEEDDATEHDQDNGHGCGVILVEDSLQVASGHQGDDSNGHQGNTAQLEKREMELVNLFEHFWSCDSGLIFRELIVVNDFKLLYFCYF